MRLAFSPPFVRYREIDEDIKKEVAGLYNTANSIKHFCKSEILHKIHFYKSVLL